MAAVVLIVDDDPHVVSGIKRVLHKQGVECHGASSAAEALKFLEQGPVELIITDEKMPGMSGHQLLTLVAQQYPDTMRIMLTGHADLETAVKAINEGRIYRFLTKPVSASELTVAVHQALEHRRLLVEVGKLKAALRKQTDVIKELERRYPGISDLETDSDGRIILDMD